MAATVLPCKGNEPLSLLIHLSHVNDSTWTSTVHCTEVAALWEARGWRRDAIKRQWAPSPIALFYSSRQSISVRGRFKRPRRSVSDGLRPWPWSFNCECNQSSSMSPRPKLMAFWLYGVNVLTWFVSWNWSVILIAFIFLLLFFTPEPWRNQSKLLYSPLDRTSRHAVGCPSALACGRNEGPSRRCVARGAEVIASFLFFISSFQSFAHLSHSQESHFPVSVWQNSQHSTEPIGLWSPNFRSFIKVCQAVFLLFFFKEAPSIPSAWARSPG